MKIPLLMKDTVSISLRDEFSELGQSIKDAVEIYKVEGIVHGGISSMFQKQAFENLCRQRDRCIDTTME